MTEASPLAAPERSALPVMWSAPCGVARRTRYGVPRLAVNSCTTFLTPLVAWSTEV